ncbi:MAG: hypothetical protein DWQ08_07685 [Proteobacteria bacterium]|nr:MAG: hypothetical protein DWQ08_07685 [Pseudomonadota bacterium]
MKRPFQDRRVATRLTRFFGGVLATVTMLVAGALLAAEVSTSFSSKISGDIPVKTEETEFTCSDTIYALLETRGLAVGVHDVEIHWFDPRGERQELTKFSAHVAGDDTIIWGWLRLHAPEGAGLVRTFDPSMGMRSFIGQWKVKVFIDGKQVDTARFDVLC